ncbi:hypothetical protein FHS19_003319 [Paenibacillus rhizosphaerae]|uniref:Uncharacterized protein n=1 Tax=Paenibacillus rhizosphaerae TaxID=297318 RepID=A0A839TPH2_9BACL|nr:hypothetical protein [Paenibacillus rhizosphaerae]
MPRRLEREAPAERQPNHCPKNVPKGTPTMFAAEEPLTIIDTAQPRLRSGTMPEATTAAAPMKEPCVREASTRAAISMLKPEAAMANPLPTTNRIIRNRRRLRLENLPVKRMTNWRGQRDTERVGQ